MCRPVFWSTSCDGDRLNDRKRSFGQSRGLRSLAKHELGHRTDDATLLGDRYEDYRRNRAKIAVGPARQRLEPYCPARLEVDDRLEVGLHLTGGNGAAQRLLDAGDALGGLLHLACIDDDAAPTGAFRLVQRRLGLVDQYVGGLVAKMEQRTPDRRRKARRALADIIGRGQDLDQHARLVGCGVLGKDQGI